MRLKIILLFGIVCTVGAIYKVPEHDTCVLKVLLCDDFTKPLTPIDKSTLEMFESIVQLNEVCADLSKFRDCLKNAEDFCKENAKLNVGFDLLNNRRLAFSLCERDSPLQQVYMIVEGCVNKYSHSAIEFCTDRAVDTVGLDFYLDDYDKECEFLGTMQHCHIAIITDQCGSIAGNMLEKLVVYRGERDFMCIGYEKNRLKNIEAFNATMYSYAQRYRDTVYQNETEDKTEKTVVENLNSASQETESQFQSRISPILDEDLASDNEYTSNGKDCFDLKMSYCTGKPVSSYLEKNKILDPEYTSQNSAQQTRRTYDQPTRKVLSDENSACKTMASFLLMGIRPNGKHFELEYGVADVLWDTVLPLKNLSCTLTVNSSAPAHLGKCLILIDNSLEAPNGCEKLECDRPFNATIAVYETLSESEAKKVAELRVHSFLKYSSTLEGRLDNVIKFFENHAHDIRFWCAEHHEANLYKELNRVQSTDRKGFIPNDIYKYDTEDEERKISEQEYDIYLDEQARYPIVTNMHLISSGDEDKIGVVNNYEPQNYDEIRSNIFREENYGEISTPRPSTKPKSFNSYRPNELFRPRIGEALEAEHQMSSEDLGMTDVEDCDLNSNVLSYEDTTKSSYTKNLNSEETCRQLPENISKLVNKPGQHSGVNFVNIDNALEIESELHETGRDIPFSNRIWRAEEPENIDNHNERNNFEIYVTPSTKIETTDVFNKEAVDATMQNLDENPEILNECNQNFGEVPMDSNLKDSMVENDFNDNSENAKSFKAGSLESTNQELASEEGQFSPNSKVFSKRSGKKYGIGKKEKFLNPFKVVSKVKLDARRLRKTLIKKTMGRK